MTEAREYANAYSKALARSGRRRTFLGDDKAWMNPKREWTENTFYGGSAGTPGVPTRYPEYGVGSQVGRSSPGAPYGVPFTIHTNPNPGMV